MNHGIHQEVGNAKQGSSVGLKKTARAATILNFYFTWYGASLPLKPYAHVFIWRPARLHPERLRL